MRMYAPFVCSFLISFLMPLIVSAQSEHPLLFRMPFLAEDLESESFRVSAFVDHNSDKSRISDPFCGKLTYDGHRGTDFALHPYEKRWEVLESGKTVVAAAEGEVIYAVDGYFDRCETRNCGNVSFGNHVIIRHPDNSHTFYGHLKKFSVSVKTGDLVTCGQKIGDVGSSGYSSGPHLHFEIRKSRFGSGLDPFHAQCSGKTLWVDQQDYPDQLPAPVCHGDSDTSSSDPTIKPLSENALISVTLSSQKAFPGDEITAWFSIKNSGETTWNDNGNTYSIERNGLGYFEKQSDSENFITSQVLPQNTIQLSANLLIPANLTAKNYLETWQMKHNDIFFGNTIKIQVSIDTPIFKSKFAGETIPDKTAFAKGSNFIKSWTMRNAGNITWKETDGLFLKFISGNSLSGSIKIELSPGIKVSPNDTHTFTTSMTAPQTKGTYRGYWQMYHPNKGYFGDKVWVEIVVTDS